MEEVQTELILSDLEVCSKKKNKKGLTPQESKLLIKVFNQLDKGDPVRLLDFTIDEIPILNTLSLITSKPLIFACNIDADSYSKHGNELTKKFIDHVN